MRVFRKGLELLRRRGMGYPIYLLTKVWLPRVTYRILLSRFPTVRKRVLVGAACTVGAVLGISILWWLTVSSGWVVSVASAALGTLVSAGVGVRKRAKIAAIAPKPPLTSNMAHGFLKWKDWPFPPSVRDAVGMTPKSNNSDDIVLGEIDNDGRLLARFGGVPGIPRVSETGFTARVRFALSLVVKNDLVLVRKDFRGNRKAFFRELSALVRLPDTVRAPSVFSADTKNLVLYKAFVPGRTVREILVEAGAAILTCQTRDDPSLFGLDSRARIEAVWQRGQEVLESALGAEFRDALESQVDTIHREGVTGFSLTFGNVVVHQETGFPWLIDFDNAIVHRSTRTMAFRRRRDRDRELFNTIWGGSLMTESEARMILSSPSHTYSPVDLGGGLVSPGFWSVDSGMGRWEYLNRPVLDRLVRGRRVLDLGSNNGVMCLMMLRAGADEVVGLEKDPKLVEEARQMQRIFEWRDMTRYALDVRCLDMRAIVEQDFGSFDMVTAFCSLYYLPEQDMERVARAARDAARIFVVQAKTDTRSYAAESKAKKSSVEYLAGLMRSVGFRHIDVIAPRGYSRPLLIGTR